MLEEFFGEKQIQYVEAGGGGNKVGSWGIVVFSHDPKRVSLILGFFQIQTYFSKCLEEHIQDVSCFFSHVSIV